MYNDTLNNRSKIMAFRSEQEILADLIGKDSEEGFDQSKDGGDMIYDSLRKTIKADPNIVREIEDEINNSGRDIERTSGSRDLNSNLTQEYRRSKRQRVKFSEDVSVENLFLELDDVHRGLIHIFESLDFNSPLADLTIKNINRLGEAIRSIGGTVEEFNPIDHVSGLESPDIIENIEKVIATTKRCYKVGTIKDIGWYEENGEYTIRVSLSGYDKGSKVTYNVEGEITSDLWEGNEALDYVYTPGSGKLSVKCYEKGRWIDKSFENDTYSLYWDLTEDKRGQEESPKITKDLNNRPSIINEEKEEEKEEEKKVDEEISENKFLNNNKGKTDMDEENDINEDFPIIEN